MRVNIISKRNTDNYLNRGDLIIIYGRIRRIMGVCLSNTEAIMQGWLRVKVVELKKYDKKHYKIYRDGKLIKYVRLK